MTRSPGDLLIKGQGPGPENVLLACPPEWDTFTTPHFLSLLEYPPAPKRTFSQPRPLALKVSRVVERVHSGGRSQKNVHRSRPLALY